MEGKLALLHLISLQRGLRKSRRENREGEGERGGGGIKREGGVREKGQERE